MIRRLAFTLMFVIFSPLALLAQEDCCSGRRCADALGEYTLPKIRMFNSGRDADQHTELRDAAKIIYEIAADLGLKIPNMVIKSLDANDMAALTANSGHPAPHWYDGGEVMRSAKRAGNILEFVEAGRDSHVQFVRDVNDPLDTVIVYAHVGGHYDFAERSYVFRVRDPDRIRDSLSLSQYMAGLYLDHDTTEIDQFYQWMLSLKFLQDTARGSFQAPESFKPERSSRRVRIENPGNPLGIFKTEEAHVDPQHPAAPTPSILQAAVENLPATAADYKVELLRRFERLHRVFPAIMLTKIMNEGWATMQEYILLSHSPWNNGRDMLDLAAINSMVTYPSLSNPYWLGLQAWLRVRERFLDENNLREAEPREQDRRFIQYAGDLIARYTDYEFLMFALDAKWVEKHKLFLYRKAGPEDGISPYEGEKNIAITRDPKRVVRRIADRVANFETKLPQIELVSFNDRETGAIRMRQRAVNDIPLDRGSLAKTTYVLSRLFERPVVIESTGSSLWKNPREKATSFVFELKVSPSGEVELLSGEEQLPEGFLDRMRNQILVYQQDQAFTYPHTAGSEQWNRLISTALEQQSPPMDELANLMGHAPTASKAVLKFKQLMEHRSRRIMQLAAQGKWPIGYNQDGTKVRIQVFPDIPQYDLDQRVANKLRSQLPPTPVARGSRLQRPASMDITAFMRDSEINALSRFEDRDLDINSGPHQPGDIWDRPSDGEGGGGEPDEGSDGEPSDEAGDQAGSGPGDPQNDPSVVEIPTEIFAQMIAEQFELRNLRKLINGKNRIDKMRREGAIQKPAGVLVQTRTVENDIRNGIVAIISEGGNPEDYTVDEIFEIGVKLRTPADHVVKARRPVLKPDMDAVIIYVADTSGSMGEEHRKVERKMVAYISSILKSVYPALEERFVIYDTEALEVDRDEFFKRYQGGGTTTVSGLKVAKDILEEFPVDRYNRFMHLFSDGGDWSMDEAIGFVRELIEEIEYFGYGHVQPKNASWSEKGPLSEAFEALAEELREKVGYAELDETHQSLMIALRRFYGKDPDAQ